MVYNAIEAANKLEDNGISIEVVNCRFIKPMDTSCLENIRSRFSKIITIEEGSIGGFGSHVSQFLTEKNLLDNNLKFRSMILPDRFIDHNKPDLMYKYAGLDSASIETKILDTLNSKIIIKKTN